MIMPILAVTDLAASLKFYVEDLGWAKVMEMPGADGVVNFAFVAFGEGNMVGLSVNDAPAPRGSGVAIMVYVPDDQKIDDYYAACGSRGVNFAVEIHDEYWGDRTFSVADPDGYFFMIAQTVQNVSMDDIAASHASQ